MTFNLELSGEQVQKIRVALMRASNQAYTDGKVEKSLELDMIEECILAQVYEQREVAA